MKKTVSFSKGARNIFFHILTDCNLKCRHCYINKLQHGKNTLSLNIIELWLKTFIKKGKDNNLIFLGGEPTLHPELYKAVKTAKDIGYQSVTIDTNGFLFNNILSKVNCDLVDWFSFSLDGPVSSINDAIRGKNSFDQCIKGIKKAVNSGFNVSLIYTVSQFNIKELKNMPQLLEELGIKRFFIQVLGLRGKSADNINLTCADKDIWLNEIPAAALKAANAGITVSYPKVYLEKNEQFECAGILAENFFIFPNGRVYRCPLCEDYPMHSLTIDTQGNLKNTPAINETDLFNLNIAEGCVINKLIQPANIKYSKNNIPEYKIACCMLKEQINPLNQP